MKIIHFDVDEYLDPLIEGEKQSKSLQDLDLKKYAKSTAITIKSVSKADSSILSQFPSLELLITRTVGVDHIDLDYCKKKNIAVYHIIDYGSFNIAEHTFALLLTGVRNILSSQKEIKKGIFSYAKHLSVSLQHKTLGIVGTGRIGLELIKRAKGFEMNVIAFDVYKNEKAQKELGFEYVSLEELAEKSDVISLHAPLMDSTKHMINEKIISKMKKGVVLINTARGGLIDTCALVNNINKFRFIGLDVVEGEDHFAKDHPLLKFENVVITPHIAFYSDASVKKIAEETKKLIHNYENGVNEGRVV